MKICSHSKSRIVELEDGSCWQIFPGDLDLTLDWKPETELTVVEAEAEVATHELLGGGWKVRGPGPSATLVCEEHQGCAEEGMTRMRLRRTPQPA